MSLSKGSSSNIRTISLYWPARASYPRASAFFPVYSFANTGVFFPSPFELFPKQICLEIKFRIRFIGRSIGFDSNVLGRSSASRNVFDESVSAESGVLLLFAATLILFSKVLRAHCVPDSKYDNITYITLYCAIAYTGAGRPDDRIFAGGSYFSYPTYSSNRLQLYVLTGLFFPRARTTYTRTRVLHTMHILKEHNVRHRVKSPGACTGRLVNTHASG